MIILNGWKHDMFRSVPLFVHYSAVLEHLESVGVGYSDIFMEYSIYLTTTSRSICLE